MTQESYIKCRDHATEGYVENHQCADRQHRAGIGQAEQDLDQRAGADHLTDQIHADHDQGRTGRQQPHGAGLQAEADGIGKSVAAEIA